MVTYYRYRVYFFTFALDTNQCLKYEILIDPQQMGEVSIWNYTKGVGEAEN